MPNAQFSSDKTAPTRAAASPRMRIENWELRIGQILPNVHSAKLFLTKPLVSPILVVEDSLALRVVKQVRRASLEKCPAATRQRAKGDRHTDLGGECL